MSTAHAVLGLLARGDRHGYDLKREYDSTFALAKPLGFGQVYATLERLARDGLVSAEAAGRDGGPDRTAYSLTAEGRRVLGEWLADVEPPLPHVANVLFAKVVLALLADDSGTSSRRYLARQREAHLARMREFTALKTDPRTALPEVLVADYAIAHLDADLRWIELALARVDQLRAVTVAPTGGSR